MGCIKKDTQTINHNRQVQRQLCQKDEKEEEINKMGRPKKPKEQKLFEGTFRKDRDTKPIIEDKKYEIINKKLLETETIINETPVKENAKILLDYVNLYKKLIEILSTPLPEKAETKDNDAIIDHLIKNKNA
jgi:hypothetical protein